MMTGRSSYFLCALVIIILIGCWHWIDPINFNNPKIKFFSISDASIYKSQSAMLNWEVENAESVSIDQDVGTVDLIGSKEVTPDANTEYTLTASNPAGSSKRTVQIEVKSKPEIKSFSIDPKSIYQSQSATLNWEVENAESVSIDQDVGTVDLCGPKEVTPDANTEYTLTASNPAGSSKRAVQIEVKGKPEIAFFKACLDRIPTYTSTELKWEVINAESVSIDNNIGSVGPSGTKPVSPIETTTYALTATNPAGPKTATTKIKVSDVVSGYCTKYC